MPTQVLMPQLGESVVEGTITKWLKAKGDRVAEYEPLLEVNTDKVDTEVPSPAAGILLDILVPEGTTVHAGAQLAVIGEAGENGQSAITEPVEAEPVHAEPAATQPVAVSQAAAAGTASSGVADVFTPAGEMPPRQAAESASAAPAPGRHRDLGFISPVVAKIASEEGVDLNQVPGTGQGGRITKKDVLAFLEQRQAEGVTRPMAVTQPVPTAAPAPARPVTSAPATGPQPSPSPAIPDGDELVPFTAVRRAIADHMVLSKRTSPHVTTVMEADLSRIVAHRQAHKDAFERDGATLTFTPYFISAIVAALKAFPNVNSSWSDDGLILHRAINVGMATSLGDAGLIVPVIKNADGLSLLGLARTVNDLANRARGRQLKPDEVKGGTFTLTNHGISGSLFATPVINQPQCGILGVGKIQKRVMVVEVPGVGDTLAIKPMVYLTLTFDHRILDGASADHFLSKVVESLENWG